MQVVCRRARIDVITGEDAEFRPQIVVHSRYEISLPNDFSFDGMDGSNKGRIGDGWEYRAPSAFASPIFPSVAYVSSVPCSTHPSHTGTAPAYTRFIFTT